VNLAAPGAHRAVIALGSNLGDREGTIRAAVRDIGSVPGVTVVAASGLVESAALKPTGVDAAAPSYLNAVILIDTELGPLNLLDAINRIEADHGRVRDVAWGDRTLDLDLIDFDNIRMVSDRLTLPHPRAWQRAFVLLPWLQVAPDAVLPDRGRVADLVAHLSDTVAEFPAEPLHSSTRNAYASESAHRRANEGAQA
jgi:2-amino-4-hydroxy-6-hydroxymethyldihydropteridine diphosphokinase